MKFVIGPDKVYFYFNDFSNSNFKNIFLGGKDPS
jgi:hypothetical protein